MTIDTNLLINNGASTRKLKKSEFIFKAYSEPRNYFQILTGEVKLFSTNSQGKDFIQGLFFQGESFGEPPLFVGRPYPCSAIAIVDSIIFKLSRDKFFSLIETNPEIAKSLLHTFARRIYDKSATAQILINRVPEQKILTFFDRLRIEAKVKNRLLIPYTRQQIADFTGLRVETVIRTIMKLKDKHKVEIVNHKVYY